MTADEARRIVTEGKTGPVDDTAVNAVVQNWYRAIEMAAKAGRTSVDQAALPALRMPITPKVRAAALERLRADGFKVEVVNLVATVSWDE